MQLVAAACQLFDSNAQCHEGLYGAIRTKGNQGEILLDALLPCVETILDRAEWPSKDIDLIVSMSLSPDHLVSKCNVMGPRIGHPLQRALNADNAFVFDAMDASLAKTLHIVNTLALSQGYSKVLIVRAENTVNLDACLQSGFDISNGVMAMLLTPCPSQRFSSLPIGKHFSPLRVTLNPFISNEKCVKGAFSLIPQAELNQAINRSLDELLSSPTSCASVSLVESWLGHSADSSCCLGPFEIPYRLANQPIDGETFHLVSVDLFSMSLNSVTLQRAGENHHA
ncbi:hypothetical protein [Enterovibrio sp. 27052020O]|uniref:hypothetical protein n=1 Tax=Enterovibrio sp. 27052020O TaxID=3241166 RepID=UPI00388F1BAF